MLFRGGKQFLFCSQRSLKLFVLSLLLSSCNETILKKNPNGGSPVNPAACLDTAISYASVNEQVFIRNCTVNGCHAGTGNGMDLTSYEAVSPLGARVKSSVLANRMPKGSVLAFEDKLMLVSWINQGTPLRAEDANMDCSSLNPPPPPPPPPPPENILPTYNSLRERVLLENCLSCHGETSENGNFSTYAAMTSEANMRLFDLENPSNSIFMQRITSTDPLLVMPPSWAGMNPLPVEVTDVMRTWIENGLTEESTER